MNYMPFKNIPEKYERYYTEIRENIEIKNLKRIYDNLKDMEKIKFKDSFLIKLKS